MTDGAEDDAQGDSHKETLVAISLSEIGIDRPPNGHTPPHGVPVIHPAEIIKKISECVNDQIAQQIREQLGGGGGSPPGGSPPPPGSSNTEPWKFLGLGMKDWAGYTLRALVAGGVLAFTAYVAIQKGFEDRPTRTETTRELDKKMGFHELHGDHPAITEVLMEHKAQLKLVQDTQIRQTIILQNQGETLKEIKEDVKSLGRRRNRNDDQ